jgi:hypothetical protein
MYLIYAEAQQKMAPGSGLALDAINAVRNRAKATPVSAITDETIQQEYLLELCFEGHRKFDLVRWGILEKTINETRNAVKVLETDTDFFNEDWVTFGSFSLDANDIPIIDTTNPTNTDPRKNSLNSNWRYYEGFDDFEPSKHYILPIPAQELGINTNLKQNQGW